MKKKTPIKLITLDTETYQGLIGDLKRIAIYDGKKVYYGYKFSDIENILINYNLLGFNVYVYIHNMEFDLRKIPEIFTNGNVNWKQSLAINGKLAKLTCKYYTFVDSFKILPMSLAKLSEGLNVEHSKLDLWSDVQEIYPNQYTDIVDFLDKCDIDDDLYLKYLGYDVMSLYEVLEAVMDIVGLKVDEFVRCVSTSSLARYIFKNGFKGTVFKDSKASRSDYEMLTCYNWRNDLETEEFLRDSYCGGRTEVFIPRLNTQGYYYDVNSLYPFVMSKWGALEKAEYPIGKPEFVTGQYAKVYFNNWLQNKIGLGFINAKVFVPMQHIPPLPVKKGKLTFPCGEIFGTWTYEELEFAMTECGVELREVYAICYFKNTFPVFKRFIEQMYFLKEEATEQGNDAVKLIAKLIYNTAYGFTGMRRDDKTSLIPFDVKDMLKVVSYDETFGFMEVPTDVNADYIQVQVASYVTSRARLTLLKGLKGILNKSGNVYYCDTDSIVSDIPMPPELLHKSKLGYWAEECKPIKALFLRPKVYTLVLEAKGGTQDKVKFKGISKDTQKELNYDFYENLYQELTAGEQDSILIEKNKLMLRSIMYMAKNNVDFKHYETRDKQMNLKTMEKRQIDYINNKTKPHFFPTEQDFMDFKYKKLEKIVEFDMTGDVNE